MNFPSPEFDEAVAAVCDGSLSERQAEELNVLLRTDTAARDEYLWRVELHARLACDAEAILGGDANAVSLRSPLHLWVRPVLALAACVTLLAGGAWWWRSDMRKNSVVQNSVGPAVVMLAEVSGTVWSRAEGETEMVVANAGMRLPAGDLQTQSPMSTAVLRFNDGTDVALSGEAKLGFEDAGQKKLRVLAGGFTAQVKSQPTGKPLIVRTTTAELQVLGTVFSVAAAPGSTRLDVQSGTVKMTRLADGASVDVPKNSSATASSLPDGKMNASLRAPLPESWTQRFDSGLPEGWRLGEWMTETGPDGSTHGFVQAVLESYPGSKQPNHTIGTIHARSSPAGALARLTDDTVLRLKVRRARRSALHIFVCARPLDEPTGAQMLQLHEVPAWRDLPPGQWGEITLRLADFEQSPATSSGPRGVHYIAITTYEADAGLELTEIALEPR